MGEYRSERAPGLLRLAGWLTILSGVVQVTIGALLIAFRDDVLEKVREYSSAELTGVAIAAIVVGLVYVLVGRGFLRLNSFALSLGVSFSGLAIVGDAIFLISNQSNHSGVLLSLAINVVVLLAAASGFSARRASG